MHNKFLLALTTSVLLVFAFGSDSYADTSKIIESNHNQLSSPSFAKHSKQQQISALILPGSLQKNIVRIAKANGWQQVVWKSDQDYDWVGRTRIIGNSLPNIMGQLLESYPLQAVFYTGNHILVIQTRTIK